MSFQLDEEYLVRGGCVCIFDVTELEDKLWSFHPVNMDKTIKTIWIESEDKAPISGGQSYTDDNSDVIVTFSDDKKYVATFFTYDNVKTLTEKNKRTGELLSGTYFWASDMILVDRIDRETIEIVIDDLIKENYFDQLFKSVK